MAYALLLEPQKMQNFLLSDSAVSACRLVGSEITVSSDANPLGFLTDHIAREIEKAIAIAIIANKTGLLAIVLNDSGRTGCTLGWGIVDEVESVGVGW
jgi:hypothetical protein